MHNLTAPRVWQALEALAEAHKLSLSGLAKKAGLDATALNPSKRTKDGRPRWPSTETIAKLLQATGTSVAEFAALLGNETMPQQIPLLGLGQAGNAGYFDHQGYPHGKGWERIALSDFFAETKTYAIEVSGDSMEPLYRDRDQVIVNPAAEIRRGDRVVVQLEKGEVLIKELVRRTVKAVQLRSLNPDYAEITIPVTELRALHKIVLVSQ